MKENCMKMNRADRGDLTKGPIATQLILFSLPLLGSSLIQQLYNTVDIMFVGRLLTTEAVAAVGASSLIVTCILGFFTGVGVGVGVLSGHSYGAKDYKRLHDVIHTAAAFALIAALAVTILCIGLAPTFLSWLGTPQDIMELAVVYVRIYFLSIFSIVSFNISSGILRALGNSKAPMYYQLAGGITNVFADFIFLYVFHMGVAGAALATFCSQTMAAVLTIRHLFAMNPQYRLKIQDIRFYKGNLAGILRIGIPSGIQSMIITFSNLIVQSQINSLGVTSIAAFTSYFKVECFIYLPIVSIGQSASTFTSQNIGAGDVPRVKKGARIAILLGVGLTVVLSGILLLFSQVSFSWFTRDPSVIVLGSQLARRAFPFYFLYVFMEVYASTIRGAGHPIPPMCIIIFNSCIMRTIILLLIMHSSPAATSVVFIYPITWALNAILFSAYYHSGRW